MNRKLFFCSKYFLLIGLGSLLLFGILGCRQKRSTIKVGLNVELTGEVPAVGASCLHAATLFAEEVNHEGGLLIGKKRLPIELVTIDNLGKANQAASATQRLIANENVIAMIGPNVSSAAIPASDIAESLGCLMISPWSTNPRTTQKEKTGTYKKSVYQACFTAPHEIPLLVNFARKELGAKRAAIIYDMSSECPSTAAQLFQKHFKESGGEIVAVETFSTGDRDFNAQLTKIKATNPDLLFMPVYYNDVPLMAKQARENGISAAFLGEDIWSTPEILTLDTGHYLEGAHFPNHFSLDSSLPEAKAFIAAYREKFHTSPDDIAALTYDSMTLLVKALSQANSLDREKLIDAMEKVRNFHGVTGDFFFPEGAHNPEKTFVILKIQQGAFHLDQTLSPQKQNSP